MTVKLFVSLFQEEGQLMIKRNRREISICPLSQSKIELLKAGVSAICQFRRHRYAFSKSIRSKCSKTRRLCGHLHLSRSRSTVVSSVKLINNTHNSKGSLCLSKG